MNYKKIFIILLIFGFFICLNSSYAVLNETNINSIEINDEMELIEEENVDSGDDFLGMVVSDNQNYSDEVPDVLGSSKKNTVKTKITAKDITKYYQDGTCVHAYLKNSNGKALSGKKITIKFDGKTYTRKTDSKGCVKFEVTKAPGSYTVKFHFEASGYKSSSETVKVKVKPMPTTLSANNLVFTYGDKNNQLNAYLKDKNGKALSDKVVVFKFNDRKYKRTTNSKGMVSLTIGASPKTYSTLISFSSSNYVASSKLVSVTVNSIPSSLTMADLNCNYENNNYL